MIIKSDRKKIPSININGMYIERKDYIKYLGVHIDQCLTWDQQIKLVHRKISKNIGIISK
jgi:hypothetical protein